MNRVQMILVDLLYLKHNVGSYPKGMFIIKNYMDDSETENSFWVTTFGGHFDDKKFPIAPYEEAPKVYVNGKRYYSYDSLTALEAADHGTFFDLVKQETILKFPEYDYFLTYRVAGFESVGLVSEATNSLLDIPVEARYGGKHFDTTLIEPSVNDSRQLDHLLSSRMTFHDVTFSVINDGRYDEWREKAFGAMVYYLIAEKESAPFTLVDFEVVSYGSVVKIEANGLDTMTLTTKDPRNIQNVKVNPHTFSFRDSSRLDPNLIGKRKPFLYASNNLPHSSTGAETGFFLPTYRFYSTKNTEHIRYVAQTLPIAKYYRYGIGRVLMKWKGTSDVGAFDEIFICDRQPGGQPGVTDCRYFEFNHDDGLLILNMKLMNPNQRKGNFECFVDPYGPWLSLDNNPDVAPGNILDTALVLFNYFANIDYTPDNYDIDAIDALRKTAPNSTLYYVGTQGENLQKVIEQLLYSGNYRMQPIKGRLTITQLAKKSATYYIKEDEVDLSSVRVSTNSEFVMNTIKLNYFENPSEKVFQRSLFDSSLAPEDTIQQIDYEENIYLQDPIEVAGILKARYDAYASVPTIIKLKMTVPIPFELLDYVLYTFKRPYVDEVIIPLSYYEVIGISKTAKTVTLLYSHPFGGNQFGEFSGKPYGPQDVYLESPYGLLIEGVA